MTIEAPIDVRPAEPGDYPALARLLAETFQGKFAIALGRDPDARACRIETLLPFGIVCPGHIYILTVGAVMAASFTVKTAETEPPADAYRRAYQALRAADGQLRAWWAVTIFRLFGGMNLGPQDCYLDNLVTAKAFRRQGLAVHMANFLYELGRSLGKTTLWADVMSSNFKVIGLYEKEGWQVAGRNYWVAPITWPLLGTPGIIRIRKPL